MDKEIITKKQLISIMTTFLIGSSMVLGVGSKAGRDAWVAVILAYAAALIISLVFSRILSLFPGKGLYEILLNVFGRVAGRIVIILYAWYGFHLGALVLRNFSEFVKIVGLLNTPQYITLIALILLCIWAVKEGIEVIGRWTAIILPIIIFAIFVVTLLVIPEVKIDNIIPFLYNGVRPVLDASFSVFAFPFAELVLCMVIFGNLKNKNNPVKLYLWSLSIGGSILLIITTRSILALGEANISIQFFASYITVRLISIGDYLERIEVSVAIVFLLGGFVKVSICLLAACKGIAEAFKLGSYKRIVFPIGLLMVLAASTMFANTLEMLEFADKTYKYYALPFEVVMPLIIWASAEFKNKKQS